MFNLDAAISQGSIPQKDTFHPTNGQASFTLSKTPRDVLAVEVKTGGAVYLAGAAGGGLFTVSGTTLTWAGPALTTDNDPFEVNYQT